MTTVKLPYLHSYRDRHGRWRHYFRRTNYPRVALPGEPGSLIFIQAYEAAYSAPKLQRRPGEDKLVPRSLGALIVEYYQSKKFVLLAPSTMQTYRGLLEAMRRDFGDLPVSSLRLRNIENLMAKRADRPNVANKLLKMFKILMRLAVKLGWRSDNPTIGIEKFDYESDGYLTWPEEEIERFENYWPIGTTQRLAFDLLVQTGLRSVDVRQLGRQHLSAEGDALIVRPQKTRRYNKTPDQIPITPALKASLDLIPAEQLIFVSHGSLPYGAGGFGRFICSAARKAGVPVGYSPHGLRKAAAVRLAEAGATEAEIMSITGHKSPQEVQRYIRAANQKTMAQNAQKKVAAMRAKRELDRSNSG